MFEAFINIMKAINISYGVSYQLLSSEDKKYLVLSKNDKIFVLQVMTKEEETGGVYLLFDMVNEYTRIFHKMFHDNTFEDLKKREYHFLYFKFIK